MPDKVRANIYSKLTLLSAHSIATFISAKEKQSCASLPTLVKHTEMVIDFKRIILACMSTTLRTKLLPQDERELLSRNGTEVIPFPTL